MTAKHSAQIHSFRGNTFTSFSAVVIVHTDSFFLDPAAFNENEDTQEPRHFTVGSSHFTTSRIILFKKTVVSSCRIRLAYRYIDVLFKHVFWTSDRLDLHDVFTVFLIRVRYL